MLYNNNLSKKGVFSMKNIIKRLGFIAIVSAIGFSFTGCDEEDGTFSWGSGGSNEPINPTITIVNNTGYTINGIWIKASTAVHWGNNVGSWLQDGQSQTFTLSQPLSVQNVYDIRLSGGGFNFSQYGVTVSNNMTITFTTAHLDDGSSLPTITIQNRSGQSFDTFRIKPSASSDWGQGFGWIGNNSDMTVTIPIPPSNFRVFDIQMTSSNPTNTYTRNNITISDGMALMFTSADADNPTIELPVIVIQNNTGYTIQSVWIRPSGSDNWGSNLGSWLQDGQSQTFRLPQHLSAQNVYDIRLAQNWNGGGFNFIKHNLTVSEGMVINFTTGDLD